MSIAVRCLHAAKPRHSLYQRVACNASIVLISIWTIFMVIVIQPESLMQELIMTSPVLLWGVGPLVVVAAVVGWRWHVASSRVQPAPVHLETPAAQRTEQATREYVLEIVSVGVTFDKYRQGALWDELARGGPRATLREQDPKKYEWSAQDKVGVQGSRTLDAAENGASVTPEFWCAPTFYADSPDGPIDPASAINPVAGMLGGAKTNGMLLHMFATSDWELSERPDHLIERVFAFFDRHPDLPYAVLSAADGLDFRDLYRPPGTAPLIRDGYYVPPMPDSAALFVLARRERVDAVRPFTWGDPDNSFLQKTFRTAYWELAASVPVIPSMKGIPRHPTVDEWLKFSAEFVKRDDVYPHGTTALIDRFIPRSHRPPRNFKPTPWFPLPWTTEQLEVFDGLPTLGYLHRPVFVKTVDDRGRPLLRRDARAAALAAGWQQAIETLPESERKTAPARIVTASGGNVEQTIAWTTVMDQWAAKGGPELDKSKSTQWIDTDARLGNTGAATLFMQMAIGVMGSQREGGVSAAINLRDPGEASIVMISPPPEDKRLKQQPYVFKSNVTPSIDPENYKQ